MLTINSGVNETDISAYNNKYYYLIKMSKYFDAGNEIASADIEAL